MKPAIVCTNCGTPHHPPVDAIEYACRFCPAVLDVKSGVWTVPSSTVAQTVAEPKPKGRSASNDPKNDPAPLVGGAESTQEN